MTGIYSGLREGMRAQNFELPDQNGQTFNLHQRLKDGPLVLVFYRGGPYCNGQLVSYARQVDEFQKLGFGVVEKLGLLYPLLSDPRGNVIKSLGLWNEAEGVSEPAIIVLDGVGEVRHLYSGGSDFSDRPPEGDLLEMLEEVGGQGDIEYGEPGVRVSAEEAESDSVCPDKGAMTLEALQPYYLGTHFATVAMQTKLEGEARDRVADYQKLVDEYNAAIRETVKKS